MTIKRWVWVWVGMVLATACGATSRGAFRSNQFSSGYGYDVRYQRDQLLLPPAWRLDNFERRQGEWVAKKRGEYETTYEFDDDGDGTKEAKIQATTYALRFEHRRNGGQIWIRNIAIAPRLRDKELRVLMQTYVDDLAGASYEQAQPREESQRREDEHTRVVERRQAATIVAQQAVTLAGQPAYLATLDLANIDQIRLESAARSRRVQLVMWYPSGTEGGAAREDRGDDRTYADRPTGVAQASRRYPVLAVAAYSNLPVDFDSGLGDFHDLLARITVSGQSGFVAPVAAPAPPAAALASPASASPASAGTP